MASRKLIQAAGMLVNKRPKATRYTTNEGDVTVPGRSIKDKLLGRSEISIDRSKVMNQKPKKFKSGLPDQKTYGKGWK